MGAWLRRAEELGILSESRVRRMWELFSQAGWRTREPVEQFPFEAPGRLTRLVHRLVAEDIISRSRAAELLNLSEGVELRKVTM